jgi:hypothetical protein
MANEQNLKPFTGKNDPRNGRKPKGTLNLSTHIQNLLNDESLEDLYVTTSKGAKKKVKGVPIKAVIYVALKKALEGEPVSREWLAKYGYGTNVPDSPEELHVTYEVVNRIPEPKEE